MFWGVFMKVWIWSAMPCTSNVLCVGILLVSAIFLARGSVANLQVFSFCCFLILPFGSTLLYFGSTINSHVNITRQHYSSTLLFLYLHTHSSVFLLDFLITTLLFLLDYPIVQNIENNRFWDLVCGGDACYLIFRNSSVLSALILHQLFASI